MVIPPLAAEKIGLGTTIIENLCYLYKYDDKNRLVEKKLPGKGKEYMVYDKQDRLVATQDANLRADNKWLFTKYDKFGRVVYTGIFTSSANRQSLQTSVNGFGSNNEERKSSVQFTQNGLGVYYTKTNFPTGFSDILSVNYYDTYEGQAPDLQQLFEHAPLSDANGQLKGLPVSSFVRVIGTTGWEKAYTAYDSLRRPVGAYKLNHLGGFTLTESELNFKGLPTKTTTAHKSTNNGIQVNVEETFVYDQMLRLLSHHHSINGQTPQLIAKNEYDPLGQLVSKKVGGNQNGSDRWQEVDYKYNIRGWLTDINDVGLVLYGKDAEPPTSGDDLFAFKINYNVLNDGGSQYAEPLYNGNIAQTIWRTGDDNVKRGYVYNYDELNRLLEAQFYKSDNNPYTGAYTENLAYDLNGNITSLFRTTGDVYGESVGMDDLAYSYQDGNGNSNLLLNVSDAVSNQNTGGFKDGNTNPALDDYEYDANGNMVKDRNKGITSITYNHLNLPERIEWSANKFITYQYNAAGQKVTKTVRSNDSIKVVRYLDGFQYAGDILQFFPHSEGYVKATPTGNITPGAPPTAYAYNYVFNYTDHLGNIRLSYTKDPQQGTLKILEENHYYPFGLKHEVYVTGSKRDFIENSNDPGETILTNVLKTAYQYKYNGKEFQDELNLNLYDYGARNYDPALGRWMNVDPLAHRYSSINPYNYAINNPVIFIDVDGMKIMNGDKEMKEKIDDKITRNEKRLSDVVKSYGGLTKKNDLIKEYGKVEGKKAFTRIKNIKDATKSLKNESERLGNQIKNTEAKIKELKKNAPNMFNKLDNLKNEYGETVDVYLHSSDDLGINDGQTEMDFEFNENDTQVRPISNFGINTIQARLINSPSGNRTTLEVTKHELGHVDYQAENTAAYHNYLKNNNLLKTEHGGHTPGDPSGARAEQYQNLNDLP